MTLSSITALRDRHGLTLKAARRAYDVLNGSGRVWILGNGPTLPVDDLDLLEGEVTIGCENILKSGFRPSCILWTDKWCGPEPDTGHDGTVYGLDDYDGLTVGPLLKNPISRAHLELRVVSAHRPPERWRTDHLYIHGSVGGAAVRWAYAHGFREFVCLGMSGKPKDGRSNFFGDVPHPRKAEQYRLYQEDRDLLRAQLGDAVIFADDVRAHL